MKKFFIHILCLYSSQIYSQPLTAEQVKTDIDSEISVLSDIHPTFNNSSNKQALLELRDTICTPRTSHEIFRIQQPK